LELDIHQFMKFLSRYSGQAVVNYRQITHCNSAVCSILSFRHADCAAQIYQHKSNTRPKNGSNFLRGREHECTGGAATVIIGRYGLVRLNR
jgi:hypothetical protein